MSLQAGTPRADARTMKPRFPLTGTGESAPGCGQADAAEAALLEREHRDHAEVM